MRDVPIACSLSATAIPSRLEDFADLVRHALRERRSTRDGVRVRLSDSHENERSVRELVTAEARCCPFLDFDLRREDGALVLDVAGPPDARPVIDALFEVV